MFCSPIIRPNRIEKKKKKKEKKTHGRRTALIPVACISSVLLDCTRQHGNLLSPDLPVLLTHVPETCLTSIVITSRDSFNCSVPPASNPRYCPIHGALSVCADQRYRLLPSETTCAHPLRSTKPIHNPGNKATSSDHRVRPG